MPRTGRPRNFDKDEAVAKAMQLFWERGYESTSLADLKAAMGNISAASFYAAFGSKEALFREVLTRYLETHGQVVAPLHNPSGNPRDAIEQTLRASARMQTDPTHPFGCLLVLSTATCSAESRHIQASLAEERERNRAALLACVSRAIAAGQLPRDTDPLAFATTFNTFLIGLSIQARDGVPLAAMELSISQLMQGWDSLAAPSSRTRTKAQQAYQTVP
jgi:AcrR family transcriptional regulator